MFLTPDLESTQNLASYRTFRRSNSSFLAKLDVKTRFWRKTGFCCSLWTERCSEKMNSTTKKFIFESTPHILESCFFFDLRWITPFVVSTRHFWVPIMSTMIHIKDIEMHTDIPKDASESTHEWSMGYSMKTLCRTYSIYPTISSTHHVGHDAQYGYWNTQWYPWVSS